MDLFRSAPIAQPLAARLRATNLDEYVGQQHLLARGKPLREALEQGAPFPQPQGLIEGQQRPDVEEVESPLSRLDLPEVSQNCRQLDVRLRAALPLGDQQQVFGFQQSAPAEQRVSSPAPVRGGR